MASRTTQTPDPGFAADTGANSLQTAIVNAIVLPTLQLIVWRMFTVMPTATSQPVNVRGYVMLYLGVLAVLPLVITISSLVGSYLQAGKAGVALDFSMTVAASFLFGAPVLAVTLIMGLVVLGTLYFTLKAIFGERARNRRPPL